MLSDDGNVQPSADGGNFPPSCVGEDDEEALIDVSEDEAAAAGVGRWFNALQVTCTGVAETTEII